MKDNSKKQNIKTVECVIDNADMWMFKFEHLKKNLTDYTYEDILSKQRNVETVIANFDVECKILHRQCLFHIHILS